MFVGQVWIFRRLRVPYARLVKLFPGGNRMPCCRFQIEVPLPRQCVMEHIRSLVR
jgi:hypothetical protein